MRLDLKARKILFELEHHSRSPASDIARKVRLPKAAVAYRIAQMRREGVIMGFRAVVDLHRLGYFVYRVYFRFHQLSPEQEKPLFEKLCSSPNSITVIPLSGRWDAEILVTARNTVHFASLLMHLRQALSPYIKEYSVSPSVVNYHFRRRYLIDAPADQSPPPVYGFEPRLEKIDKTDFQLLRLLSQDGSLSLSELGRKVGLSYNGVKKRLQALERRGVIQSYRSWLNLEKMGRHYSKLLIALSYFDEKLEKSLLSFCASEPTVSYMVECTGSWDLEIDVDAEDEKGFRALLLRLRERFKNAIQDFEAVAIYPEKKLDYFPFQKFEDLNQG